jgi:hypothetical protein
MHWMLFDSSTDILVSFSMRFVNRLCAPMFLCIILSHFSLILRSCYVACPGDGDDVFLSRSFSSAKNNWSLMFWISFVAVSPTPAS